MADVSFDDLVPKKPTASKPGAVSFDDLLPDKQRTESAGPVSFDDLVPARAAEAPKGQEGFFISENPDGTFGPGKIIKPIWEGIKHLSTEGYQPGTQDEEGVKAAFNAGIVGLPGTLGLGVFGRPTAGTVGAAIAAKQAATPRAAASPAQQLAKASENLGLEVPKAAAAEGTMADVVDILKEVPVVTTNPLRARSSEALWNMGAAVEGVKRKVAGGADDGAAQSRRVLNDWLSGAGGAAEKATPEEAVKETAALRASLDLPEPASNLPKGVAEIVTPDQSMKIRAKPEIVELSDLNLASGKLQPRDRARTEYLQEARERATRLDPEQLQPNRVSDAGAPIVMQDGTVLSGNGRALSIAEVYSNPLLENQARAYRQALGPEAATMRQPVLVMRAEPLADDVAMKFADLSNRSRIATMSATERASRDAQAIGSEGLALYQGGEFDAVHNLPFMQNFMNKAVTAAERPSVSKDGRLTQEGAARLRAAVLHGAYEDAAMLSRMLESTDDNIRNITNAMADAAPEFAQLKADIRAGAVVAGMDATKELTEAVKLIADLRSRGVSPASHFAQIDAFSQTNPLVESWVRSLYNDDLTRPISRRDMADLLSAYSVEARKHAPDGLFADPTKAEDVLNVARRAVGQSDVAAQDAGPIQGANQGGTPKRQSEIPAGGGAAAEGREAVRDAGAAAARNEASAHKVISAARSEEIAFAQLIRSRNAAIANALGLHENAVTPERIVSRIAEMARSRKTAELAALANAKKLLGEKVWVDSVGPGVLNLMGGGKGWERRVYDQTLRRPGGDPVPGGEWNYETFVREWSALSNNAKNMLFRSQLRRGVREAIDDLATVLAKVPRLEQLAEGRLENFVSRVPLFGDLMRSLIRDKTGQVVTHVATAGMSSGASIVVPVAGFLASSLLSRPLSTKRTATWVDSMFKVLGEQGSKRAMVTFYAATRSLAQGLKSDFGGDVEEIEKSLLDPDMMAKLNGPAGDVSDLYEPLGQLEQQDSGNFYRSASGDLVAVNPSTDVVGKDGMVYGVKHEPPNPEAAEAAQGVNVFGKALGALGLDESGKRAQTSWRDAWRNTVGGASLANAAGHAVTAAQRATRETGGPSDAANAQIGMTLAGSIGGASSPFAALGGAPGNAVFTFAGPKAAARFARHGHTGPKKALELADKLEAQGASREKIYEETSKILDGTPFAGVSKTADGKWRFEVSDADMIVRDNPEGLEAKEAADAGLNVPGSDVAVSSYRGLVVHPMLELAYPELKNLVADIYSHDPISAGGGFSVLLGKDASGEYVTHPYIRSRGRGPEETRDIVAHELDHFAQTQENFSSGGNPPHIGPRDERRRSQARGSEFTTKPREVGPELRRYAGQVVSMPPAERLAADREAFARDVRDLSKGARSQRGKSRPPVFGRRNSSGLIEIDLDEVAAYVASRDQPLNDAAARQAAIDSAYSRSMDEEVARARNIYMRLGGETSAREAEARRTMTPEERRQNPPALDMDKPSSGVIAKLGKSHPDLEPSGLMPSRETIMALPETREIAARLHKQMSKRVKGAGDDEVWRMAFASAVEEMMRRIEKKGGWAKYDKTRKIDWEIGNRSLELEKFKKSPRWKELYGDEQ